MFGQDPRAQSGDERRGEAVAGAANGRAAQPSHPDVLAWGEELDRRHRVVEEQFRVGIADSVPKAIAYRLLEPALAVPAQVRGIGCSSPVGASGLAL